MVVKSKLFSRTFSTEIGVNTDLLLLEPGAIDCRGPWLLWKREPEPNLRDSLRRMGQLEPLLALHEGGAWALVAGHSRLRALHELGRKALVRAVDAPQEPGARREIALGLVYLASNRAYLLGEEASPALLLPAMRFFMERMEPEDLRRDVAPAVGLAPRSRTLRRLEQWCALFAPDVPWERHLLAGRLPLACVETLARLAPEELQALEPFFATLSWSSSAARQFMTLLFETSRREGAPLHAMMRPDLTDRLAAGLSPKDTQAALLDAARRLRHPRRHELERGFAALAAELSAGALWRVTPEQGFESDALHLSARCETPEQAREAARQLLRMADTPLWGRLASVGRQDPGRSLQDGEGAGHA